MIGIVTLLIGLLCLPWLAISQGPPPPGVGAVNAIEQIDYFWQGVSGFTHVAAWDPRHGKVLTNIVGPASVLLTPRFEPLVIQCRGGTNTGATAMSEGGAIVGFCTARDGTTVGFVRSPRGRYTELHVPGATRTEAVAINSREQVGGDTRGADGIIRGFLWTGGHRYTTIEIPGAAWTALTGLNTQGDTTGFAVAPDGTVTGWLRRRRRVTAVSVPGATATVPVHLNDAREVTGVYATPSGEVRSFVHTMARGYEDVSVPDAAITDVAGMHDGVYWGRVLVPGDTEEMPWLSYGFVARLVPQPLPPAGPPPPSVAFRSSAMQAPLGGLTLALCERTGGLGTMTPGKLLGRQGDCR